MLVDLSTWWVVLTCVPFEFADTVLAMATVKTLKYIDRSFVTITKDTVDNTNNP